MEPQGMYRTIVKNPLEQHLTEVIEPTWNFAGRLRDWQDHVLNAAVGFASEAGETLDIHKKMFYHTEGVDYSQKLIHELGDCCYYLTKLLQLHGLTLEEVLAANKEKLESRHPELQKVKERFSDGYIR